MLGNVHGHSNLRILKLVRHTTKKKDHQLNLVRDSGAEEKTGLKRTRFSPQTRSRAGVHRDEI